MPVKLCGGLSLIYALAVIGSSSLRAGVPAYLGETFQESPLMELAAYPLPSQARAFLMSTMETGHM